MSLRRAGSSSGLRRAGSTPAALAQSESGWTRIPGLARVALTNIGDFVGIGATAPAGSEKVRIVGALRLEGAAEQYSADAGALGPLRESYHDSATPATNDIIARRSFFGRSSTAVKREYARSDRRLADATNAAEEGAWDEYVMRAGVLTLCWRLTALGGGLNGIGAFANTGPELSISYTKTANGGLGQAGDEAGYVGFYLKSSTGVNREVVYLTGGCVTCVNGSENGFFAVNILSGGADVRVAYFGATAGARQIAFHGATPQPQGTSGANLTNNVTAGGTNDTIADFADLTTYANSAAAIRNNFHQLARKLKQINDHLRARGDFT